MDPDSRVINLSLIHIIIHMGKITIDLDLMTNHQLSFDQYLVLYHLSTGVFEQTEDQWNIFEEEAFTDRFMELKRPPVQSIMVSLKHRKFIELRPDYSFHIVNKKLFRQTKARKLDDPTIFSFREEKNFLNECERTPILNSCTKLQSFTSPEFVTAWFIFETQTRKDKTINSPLTEGSAGRLAGKLLRLCGGDEHLATQIIQQSNEETWRGIFPLRDRKHGPETKDRKELIQKWYQ